MSSNTPVAAGVSGDPATVMYSPVIAQVSACTGRLYQWNTKALKSDKNIQTAPEYKLQIAVFAGRKCLVLDD